MFYKTIKVFNLHAEKTKKSKKIVGASNSVMMGH